MVSTLNQQHSLVCTTLPLVGSWTRTSSCKRGSQTTFSCCPIVVRFLWLKIKLIAYKARNMRRHEKGFCCYTIQQLDIILGSESISVTLCVEEMISCSIFVFTFEIVLSNYPFSWSTKIRIFLVWSSLVSDMYIIQRDEYFLLKECLR